MGGPTIGIHREQACGLGLEGLENRRTNEIGSVEQQAFSVFYLMCPLLAAFIV